jgi:hypothetical protein
MASLGRTEFCISGLCRRRAKMPEALRHFTLGEWDSMLTLYGRNLLDEDYETYNGYPSIGQVWGTEVSFKY